jgi:hypothetical protein
MENQVKSALAALLTLAFSTTVSADGPAPIATISIDPPAPSRALALYLATAANRDPWSEPNPVFMEINAFLPGLEEQGCLRVVRHWVEHRTPDYQVIHFEGDATVRQQVIARYLTAERRAAALPVSSVAVTPANYKFHYIGSSSGGPAVYAFHITPRGKQPGLINGELWIDGSTGLAVHEAGYLVKRPSMFIRRLNISRDVSLRDGIPYTRTTHLEIDTRLAGRAELTIVERPSARPLSTIIETQGGENGGCTCSVGQ